MLEIYAGSNALKTIQEHGFKQELFTNFLGVERGRVARQEDEILAGVGQPTIQWASRYKSKAANLVDLKERSTEVEYRVTIYCQVQHSRSWTLVQGGYSE